MEVKWSDLTWPCKSSKFSLHHLRKISSGHAITAVLTPKSGIKGNFSIKDIQGVIALSSSD